MLSDVDSAFIKGRPDHEMSLGHHACQWCPFHLSMIIVSNTFSDLGLCQHLVGIFCFCADAFAGVPSAISLDVVDHAVYD